MMHYFHIPGRSARGSVRQFHPTTVRIPADNVCTYSGGFKAEFMKWWEDRIGCRDLMDCYYYVENDRRMFRFDLWDNAVDHALEFKLRFG